MDNSNLTLLKPTAAFIGASWAALAIGMIGYAVGVWNAAAIELNEQGYYVVLLLMGLFSAISLQKAVRDKMEGLPVTSLYYSICWFVVAASLILLWVGLFNATSVLSLKGFLGMSYVLSLLLLLPLRKMSEMRLYFLQRMLCHFSRKSSFVVKKVALLIT
jgi:uncharacterized membrane protein YiaA